MGARDLLHDMLAAGFTLEVAGEKLLVTPASNLTDDMREALRACKPELLELLAGGNAHRLAQERPYRPSPAQGNAAHADAWDDAAIARFHARTGHIRRHGFTAQDADDLAEQMHLRDVRADYRHLCLECKHYRGRCSNHKAAGLHTTDVGRGLATMFQHCPGFSEVN